MSILQLFSCCFPTHNKLSELKAPFLKKNKRFSNDSLTSTSSEFTSNSDSFTSVNDDSNDATSPRLETFDTKTNPFNGERLDPYSTIENHETLVDFLKNNDWTMSFERKIFSKTENDISLSNPSKQLKPYGRIDFETFNSEYISKLEENIKAFQIIDFKLSAIDSAQNQLFILNCYPKKSSQHPYT